MKPRYGVKRRGERLYATYQPGDRVEDLVPPDYLAIVSKHPEILGGEHAWMAGVLHREASAGMRKLIERRRQEQQGGNDD